MGTSLAVVLTMLLGGRAFAERYGESPAKVLALHGWGRTRADWNATLRGYDALALDLPGFGATPAPDSGWSTTEYAGWVRECLGDTARSGGDRPVLVGHSFGGRVAVRLAATNPELVRGIVLTGVPLLRPQTAAEKPALGFRALRFLNKWHFISNDQMEKARRKRGSADYRAAEGEMREVLVKAVNEDYADALDALASNGLPVAMVWGEHDTAAPTAMAEQARDRIGLHADLVVVPGSAHLLDDGLVTALRSAIDATAEQP
jgi:pimeloyl-ACP methyl ester carboxylesterase